MQLGTVRSAGRFTLGESSARDLADKCGNGYVISRQRGAMADDAGHYRTNVNWQIDPPLTVLGNCQKLYLWDDDVAAVCPGQQRLDHLPKVVSEHIGAAVARRPCCEGRTVGRKLSLR